MTDSKINKACCICGSVKIEVAEINPRFTVCHCDSCRQWGGGPLFAVQCGTEVKFEGAEFIKEYDSSAWASRGFCCNCGTHLFYRLIKTGSYNMPVGLFPDLEGLEMSMQYFSDKRPAYYCFANQTAEMTEAEILDHFTTQM